MRKIAIILMAVLLLVAYGCGNGVSEPSLDDPVQFAMAKFAVKQAGYQGTYYGLKETEADATATSIVVQSLEQAQNYLNNNDVVVPEDVLGMLDTNVQKLVSDAFELILDLTEGYEYNEKVKILLVNLIGSALEGAKLYQSELE